MHRSFCLLALLALLSFVLSGCLVTPTIPPPDCEAHGIPVYGLDAPVTDCEAFSLAADIAVDMLGHKISDRRFTPRHIDEVFNPAFESEEPRDAGQWAVAVRQPGVKGVGAWYSEQHGYEIAGLTYCPEHRIVIGTDDWSSNAFTHELAHAIQNCDDMGQDDNDRHEHWIENGLFLTTYESQEAFAKAVDEHYPSTTESSISTGGGS